MKYKEWEKEVIYLLQTKYSNFLGDDVESLDFPWTAWKEMYYDEGLTPKDAIIEEISCIG